MPKHRLPLLRAQGLVLEWFRRPPERLLIELRRRELHVASKYPLVKNSRLATAATPSGKLVANALGDP